MRSWRSVLVAAATVVCVTAGLMLGVPAAQAQGGDVPVPGDGGSANAGAPSTVGPQPKIAVTPEATAAVARPSGFPVYGIDVSSHQGNVNWSGVASSGASFAYAKATEGTSYVNTYFAQQYGGAKGAGLYAGAYVFARPDGDPVAQADYFYKHANYVRDGKTLPLMLDTEAPYQGLADYGHLCWKRSNASMVSWIRKFVNEIKRRSGQPMLIYTNNWWWSQCTGNSAAFADQYLDTAYWPNNPSSSHPTTLPASWTHWTFWQYGVVGDVDRDVFHGSKAQLARLADKKALNQQQQNLIPNDFNIDQHSDPAIFRPASGNWRIVRDTGTTWAHFGTRGDIPTVWNQGDGWARMGVFRPANGTWYLANPLGRMRLIEQYGTRGDIPVQAHYRGADKWTVLAVFRPWTGTWYLQGIGTFRYGAPGDIPVPGHYNYSARNGYADGIAVFRPSNGTWYLRGGGAYRFGMRGDIPVPADYNGDGNTDMAVYRPSNGTWYIRNVGTYVWGARGDVPVTGDFNGDGKADIAVFRPSNGKLYILGLRTVTIGSPGDVPIGQAPYSD